MSLALSQFSKKNAQSEAFTVFTFLPPQKSSSTLHRFLRYVDKARDTGIKMVIREAAKKCETMDKNASSMEQSTPLKMR